MIEERNRVGGLDEASVALPETPARPGRGREGEEGAAMIDDFYSEWRTRDRIADTWARAAFHCACVLGFAAVVVAVVLRSA